MDDTPYTPITEKTFERQGWEKIKDFEEVENEKDEPKKFYYYTLPIPYDTPDENAIQLVSSANDEYKDLHLKKGEYAVELDGFYGLGICFSEEELMILYKALTKKEIEPDID